MGRFFSLLTGSGSKDQGSNFIQTSSGLVDVQKKKDSNFATQPSKPIVHTLNSGKGNINLQLIEEVEQVDESTSPVKLPALVSTIGENVRNDEEENPKDEDAIVQSVRNRFQLVDDSDDDEDSEEEEESKKVD